MPATARSIEIPQDVVDKRGREPSGGGNYSDIEVPADYVLTLVDVNDFDNTKKGGAKGWKWTFRVMDCDFNEYSSFGALWKIDQIITALGGDMSVGINNIDPNAYIGQEAGGRIDWQKDPDTLGDNEANYREIKYLFPLVEEPTPL